MSWLISINSYNMHHTKTWSTTPKPNITGMETDCIKYMNEMFCQEILLRCYSYAIIGICVRVSLKELHFINNSLSLVFLWCAITCRVAIKCRDGNHTIGSFPADGIAFRAEESDRGHRSFQVKCMRVKKKQNVLSFQAEIAMPFFPPDLWMSIRLHRC